MKQIVIELGAVSDDTIITLDGEPLDGVKRFKLEQESEVGSPAILTLEFAFDVAVDLSGPVEVTVIGPRKG